MSYSSSKQVSHMASLYESIYAEVLTEEQQNQLLMVELYNTLVKEGFIEGHLVQNSILSEANWPQIGSAIAKYGPRIGNAIGTVLKHATGYGAKPSAGRILQQISTPLIATDAGGTRSRLYQAGQGAVQGLLKDPSEDSKKGKWQDSFDVFDAIKGHLIDEGYADTEVAALKIMTNMSEEWKESIIEALGLGTLAKGASMLGRVVKNVPNAVNNAIKYYEKNPAAAAPFLAPAIGAAGMNAKKQQQLQPKGAVVK